jgi:hypothetical protein
MQAVIRLSKIYLPGMAKAYESPKVKVHIGDGFKFLDDYKNAFDVIITDSSDPKGPAESLFQKPYFQLLHDALREGGIITTQGKFRYRAGFSSDTGADPSHRREPMEPPPHHQVTEGFMQGDIPNCGICIHYHSDVPVWADWLYGLLTRSEGQPQGPAAEVVTRRRSQASAILQLGNPQGQLRPAHIRRTSAERCISSLAKTTKTKADLIFDRVNRLLSSYIEVLAALTDIRVHVKSPLVPQRYAFPGLLNLLRLEVSIDYRLLLLGLNQHFRHRIHN